MGLLKNIKEKRATKKEAKQVKKAQKQELKTAKKEAKINKIQAKADVKTAKAEAIANGTYESPLKSALSGIGSALGLGGASNEEIVEEIIDPTTGVANPLAKSSNGGYVQKSNTLLYVIGGAVILVIGALFLKK